MPYDLLADLVLMAHLGFILFALFGGALALWWRRAPWVHLPAVAWGTWIEISGGVCPLTPLENALRRAAGEGAYTESFLEHYLVPVIYPSGLEPGHQLALAAGLVLVNVAFYALVIGHWRRRES